MMLPTLRKVLRKPPRAEGVSLVTAIFLVVILSGLAGAIMSLYISQQTSSALDVQGARAYQAARAGVEWGLFQQLQNNNCFPTSIVTPGAQTLGSFTVTVTCVQTHMAADEPALGTIVPGVIDAGALNTVNLAPIAGMNVGSRVSGPTILPGTTISSINAASITLSIPATGPGAPGLSFHSALDRWHIEAMACNKPAADGNCPNNASVSPDYIARRLVVEF
jgi:Tfp pilus assembly protein PilX